MRYVIAIFILICCGYSLSYAKYCWEDKNKLAAVGMIILVATAVILPVVVMTR
ncbi:hypothetical protein [Caldicoprobacter faecalis]|uniref:Uncharacterized protein n=1 Tax=Caldicoprobacter faecalis TaxID=937334 RepID=A0A1I5WS44_9FIRM|nr:hypothetical protein [Caldicoprobacter faecalis]SFQ22614.1 hypothetical protein SAMN05444406_1198 [Caldicoprobacter faecalis]